MPTQNKLFKVTIPWERNDVEQGDFCENTWAADEDTAIHQVAVSMANSHFDDEVPDVEFDSYVKEMIGNAGTYAVVDVAYAIVSDIRDLLAGPTGQFPPGAETSYRLICDLLKLEG